ncbi:tRNA uridine-5-carboxymethylaminomethyl(34) synthesis GTPase MnmE [Aminobacter sp. SR38]|jgi:tRNA modification GTPase|uniref:tRNA uridine-5-carboxymethylaminomethyl(34) synthesis GTPase MnmE n=1 Tax=Aminobacter sp. SR38 TaxID=2774562 RepID=UPI00177BE532|nr:tRNA uridine-5-carboxymethylaminomethyl(34) synthesis GTPase MnmE [Aminobacter sp. SR38]QOF74227.1 tRNA uridine-5-carboxymethylaminomethyl(34) synthesis GTPase MnmE [Aminobacter sp. SR38]
MLFTDSIAALSSGHLPSGVAIVRISGPHVRFALETIAGSLPQPRRAHFGPLCAVDGRKLDQALTLFFPGPHSFTGEDCGEFHVHGGRAVVTALLAELGKLPGFRQAEAGEFTRRAFLNGKMDLLEAEALADLINSETEAQRQFAMMNSGGAQSELYLTWRKRLIHARAMIEAEMDFADESDVPGSVSAQVWDDVHQLIADIGRHVDGYSKAEMIRDGFDVVILGAPNAGKSSLLNALVRREAAIVTDEPGTTRDLVEATLDIGGLKVRITDTAGLREPAGKVEAIGIERAKERAKAADLVLFLQDMSAPTELPPPGDASAVIIGTKLDRIKGGDAGSSFALAISTMNGEGIDGLIELIGARAAAAIGQRGDVLPSRLRHVELLNDASEYLRAALAAPETLLELKAENLRLASDRIGKLSGAVDVEDLLDVIFSQFCIGK